MNRERFVHLDTKSSFTPGGIGTPEQLARTARSFGMDALGLADTDTVSWQFLDRVSNEYGLKPLFGWHSQYVFPLDRRPRPFTLLVENAAGFTSIHRLAQKKRILEPNDLEANREGVIALSPSFSYEPLISIYDPGQLYLELTNFRDAVSLRKLEFDLKKAEKWGANIVASNHVWTPTQRDWDVVVSFLRRARHRRSRLSPGIISSLPLASLANNRTAFTHFQRLVERGSLSVNLAPFNPEGWLKIPSEMHKLFHSLPETTRATSDITDRCLPDTLPLPRLPAYPLPEGVSAHAYLQQLCESKLSERYEKNNPDIRERLNYELDVIGSKNYDDHFLIVWDLITRAREKKMRLGDIGSSTGSLVCYLLGITEIDPLAHGLSFDRFLSRVTKKIPDIDKGVDARRHRELMNLICTTFPQVGIYAYRIITLPTYEIKGAIRDTLRTFGYRDDDITSIQEMLFSGEGARIDEGLYPFLRAAHELTLRDIPTGIKNMHPSKVVFTAAPMEITGPFAVDNNRDFPVMEITKDLAESLSNFDGVSTYSHTLLDMVESRVPLTASSLPVDPNVLNMVFQGATIGIPYIETPFLRQVTEEMGRASRGQTLSKFDVAVVLALSRPGVGKSRRHEYYRRRTGLEPVNFSHPVIAEVLGDTYGVIVFQEQARDLAEKLASFTLEENEALRKAMSKDRDPLIMERLRGKFVAGASSKGVSEKEARRLFSSIAHFVHYGFLKGHAIGMTEDFIYPLAFFKLHYPKVLFAAVAKLKQGHYFHFGDPREYVREAARFGVRISL